MTFDELYESVLERLGEKKAERNYEREYALYHAKPEQKKRRAKRNEARAKMEKAGKVKKGDGKDVDHVSHNVNNNSESNLKVMDAGKNRAKNRPKGT
jgi:hypothetical protein